MKKRKTNKVITLYHFCAAFDLRRILKNGLTLGMTPVIQNGQICTIDRTQWLTADKDPKRQSWNTSNVLPYSRTAYRLTVCIPFSHRKKLIQAEELLRRFPEIDPGLVQNWEGSENWYVYIGIIPPAWIVGYKQMEKTKEV